MVNQKPKTYIRKLLTKINIYLSNIMIRQIYQNLNRKYQNGILDRKLKIIIYILKSKFVLAIKFLKDNQQNASCKNKKNPHQGSLALFSP